MKLSGARLPGVDHALFSKAPQPREVEARGEFFFRNRRAPPL